MRSSSGIVSTLPKYFTMGKFKDFMEIQVTKTLGSDGSDPNPIQTAKSAERLASNLAQDNAYDNKFAKISMMSPGTNRRKAIFDLAGTAVRNNPQGAARANPMDVGKFLTMQFDNIPKPGQSMAGKFNKFMKKMRKGMKK